jgi:ABC-type branched-subunit amino acid transport system substrate-binding protein
VGCWLTAIAGSLLIAGPLCLASTLTPPEPPAQRTLPYFNLRQSTLTYHGPSADLTNLTELRVGWFGPTNLADPLSGDLWWSANYAVQQANPTAQALPHHPQISRLLPFRLVPRWSVDPWGTGVSQLTRMVYDEEPLAVLGSVDSASTHLAEQIVAKANLPLVSPIATDQTVTLAGVSWMFACAPSDVVIARVLVDEILRCALSMRAGRGNTEGAIAANPGPVPSALCPTEREGRGAGAEFPDGAGVNGRAPRLALLAATDHESRMTTREVMREFARRHRLPDVRLDLSTSAETLDHLLSTLAERQPQVILIIAGAEESARLVRALRDDARSRISALSSAVIFGSPAVGRRRFVELAGPAAEGVCFPLLAVPAPNDAAAGDFIQAFTAERGYAPDYAAMLTYDATRVLLAAIREAGPNRDRVRSALAGLSPWAGMGGTISFDGTGQNTRTNVPVATIRRGRMEWTRNPPDARTTQSWRDELGESDIAEGMKHRPRGLPRRSRGRGRATLLVKFGH